MATPQVASLSALSFSVDAIGEAVERLEAVLPRREDSAVLADFLEDDLRQGLEAVSEVEAHFTDVLDTLRSDRLSPITLLDAAEDFRVLSRLEYLNVVVSQLRKRLSTAAGRLQKPKSPR